MIKKLVSLLDSEDFKYFEPYPKQSASPVAYPKSVTYTYYPEDYWERFMTLAPYSLTDGEINEIHYTPREYHVLSTFRVWGGLTVNATTIFLPKTLISLTWDSVSDINRYLGDIPNWEGMTKFLTLFQLKKELTQIEYYQTLLKFIHDNKLAGYDPLILKLSLILENIISKSQTDIPRDNPDTSATQTNTAAPLTIHEIELRSLYAKLITKALKADSVKTGVIFLWFGYLIETKDLQNLEKSPAVNIMYIKFLKELASEAVTPTPFPDIECAEDGNGYCHKNNTFQTYLQQLASQSRALMIDNLAALFQVDDGPPEKDRLNALGLLRKLRLEADPVQFFSTLALESLFPADYAIIFLVNAAQNKLFFPITVFDTLFNNFFMSPGSDASKIGVFLEILGTILKVEDLDYKNQLLESLLTSQCIPMTHLISALRYLENHDASLSETLCARIFAKIADHKEEDQAMRNYYMLSYSYTILNNNSISRAVKQTAVDNILSHRKKYGISLEIRIKLVRQAMAKELDIPLSTFKELLCDLKESRETMLLAETYNIAPFFKFFFQEYSKDRVNPETDRLLEEFLVTALTLPIGPDKPCTAQTHQHLLDQFLRQLFHFPDSNHKTKPKNPYVSYAQTIIARLINPSIAEDLPEPSPRYSGKTPPLHYLTNVGQHLFSEECGTTRMEEQAFAVFRPWILILSKQLKESSAPGASRKHLTHKQYENILTAMIKRYTRLSESKNNHTHLPLCLKAFQLIKLCASTALTKDHKAVHEASCKLTSLNNKLSELQKVTLSSCGTEKPTSE
ncbi:hypothetical protein ACFL96_03330, partial [Thermoproteota archaeon]